MICHVGGRRVGRLGSMQAGQGRGRPAGDRQSIFSSLHVIAHTGCHRGVRLGMESLGVQTRNFATVLTAAGK
jgi:hypothetical protein